MVTLNSYGSKVNRNTMEIYGLSTDAKPTHEIEGMAIPNGSVFIEIDTGKGYMYSEATHEWKEV